MAVISLMEEEFSRERHLISVDEFVHGVALDSYVKFIRKLNENLDCMAPSVAGPVVSVDDRIEAEMATESRAKRVAPSIDLFSFAGEHLFYEAQMFVVCRAIKPRDQFEAKLKVEGFALHLKNLIEFFYPSNPHADDVLAIDYVANWDAHRPPITPLLESARARAGRELHHLAAQRIADRPSHKEWDFDGVGQELKSVVSAFLALQPKIPQGTISELSEI